jgi:predicted regulator of Ras-like GTPase activity (Roadblock/LC7/MglB family)
MIGAPRPDRQPGIGKLLEELVEGCGARTALLVTKEGTGVASAGDTSYMSASSMAALVAGMFSATREVARMVGERQFSILLQQGESRHVHISLVNDANMMVVVFDDYQRIGRVRLQARRVGEQLAAALAADRSREHARGEISVPQFREYALDLIDTIFVTKGG